MRPIQAAFCCIAAGAIGLTATGVASAADTAEAPKASEVPYTPPPAYNWTGFYLGGHLGYAWGNSDWTASGAGISASGSLDFSQGIDTFNEAGSWFLGLQAGYNYMFPNRVVIGAEADATFPAYPNPISGLSVGGTTTLANGETYSENVYISGTARARIGYAPGDWLYYATGGFAWTDDQFMLTQPSGATDSSFLFRTGWVAGAGVEGPLIPHWTARLEYLFKDYGSVTVTFPSAGQRFTSDLTLEEVRIGLNYHFDDDAVSTKDAKAAASGGDNLSLHGQGTFSWQGYPSIRSPYEGPNSLPGGGEAREVGDLTLFAGLRLWTGAELWVDPEIDQGFGVGNTHGVAGFPTAEAYKLGLAYPYARVQRYFIRQTIDLGGDTQKIDEDTNVFAGSTTTERLVLTVGKFAIVDIFDTNKYANSPKTDFLNWAMINAGTFDYAGDAWGFTYGAAAEWYTGRWTFRGGIFDLSATPAGGVSPEAYGLDPTFKQLEYVGEIEERHDLWGQPGKLKVTGFVADGRAGLFQDAIDLALATGQPADINAVRHTYNPRPGISLNLEQQVTENLGVFFRTGWADGNVEPWDFTDIDRTVSGGVSISGKLWDRPDDRVGIGGIINGISSVHQEFLNLGGLGILIGDGKLPHPDLEEIIETYYSYSLTSSLKFSFDYQFINNPAYNTDRGPVSLFAGRVHWQF